MVTQSRILREKNSTGTSRFVKKFEKQICNASKLLGTPYSLIMTEMALCKVCDLPNKDFRPGRKTCRDCENIQRKKYYEENKAQELVRVKNYRESEEGKKNRSKWKTSDLGRAKNLEYMNTLYRTNHQYRLRVLFCSRLRKLIKKENPSVEYLGCTYEYFLKWMEYNFDEKINWDNAGKYWDIDHIKPCSSFDLTVSVQVSECFNWKNLRPLSKEENQKKGSKIEPSTIELFHVKALEFQLLNIEI